MTNINLSEGQRTHALIVAPKGGKAAEVAAYTTNSGDVLISNSTIRPFSPLDGSHMQRMNSNSSELSLNYIVNKMVKIGHCTACDNDIVATASLADAVEVAGSSIHCPMCSSEMNPKINNNQLIAALASEFDSEDEDSDENHDDEDNSDENHDDEDYSDDTDDVDNSSDDEDSDNEPSDDEDSDEDNSDDEDSDEDTEEPSDEDENHDDEDSDYSDDEDNSDEPSDDEDTEEPSDEDENHDEDQHSEHSSDKEIAKAVASLKRKMAEMSNDEDCSDDAEVVDDKDYNSDEDPEMDEDSETDEDAIPDNTVDEDGGVPYDDVYDDEDVEKATAAFKKVVAHTLGDRPIAGKRVNRPDIDKMNERARDTLNMRRGNKVDGNAYMKGQNALAADDQDECPGTTEKTGEMTKQVVTPGTKEKVAGNNKDQPKTPGTEVSGDMLVNWEKDDINLLTASANTLWVFANNEPIGKLIKEKASSGIQSRWNEKEGLQKAFIAVARRGLTATEAAQFGFEAKAYVVEGEKIIRNALQRQAMLATENAKKEVARNVDRFKQGVKSAMIAAFKGIYNDLNNPLRDQLIASLAAVSVAEPRSIVDTAFAKTADNLLIAVFNKAEEFAGKSDEVRNEIASYVANANYQSRINEGTVLAARLASNNGQLIAAKENNVASEKEIATENDYSAKLRLALRSL
jgi:hypothetical protein